MMFAAGGLFLSMVATTMWMSGDVSRMREESRAKEAQRCAQAQQADVANAQATPGTAPPASDFAVPAAEPADTSCSTSESSGGEIDPLTGQPVGQESGGFATDPGIDPATGQPATSSFDPATGQPIDPAAMPSTTIDPATGLPMTAPSGDPNNAVAVAGF